MEVWQRPSHIGVLARVTGKRGMEGGCMLGSDKYSGQVGRNQKVSCAMLRSHLVLLAQDDVAHLLPRPLPTHVRHDKSQHLVPPQTAHTSGSHNQSPGIGTCNTFATPTLGDGGCRAFNGWLVRLATCITAQAGWQ